MNASDADLTQTVHIVRRIRRLRVSDSDSPLLQRGYMERRILIAP